MKVASFSIRLSIRQQGRVWVLLLAAISAEAGCGGDGARYALSGSVTFRGQPVPTGTIIFEPDRAKGNHGPPGFAKISAGKYDTRLSDSQGTIGGPHVVRIIGLDGITSGELINGLPLFPEHSVSADLPRHNATQDFEVRLGKAGPP